MALEVRTAEDGDREALHQLGQRAFSGRPADYDEATDRSGVPLHRRLVATDGGKIVGRLVVWELGQWFGGSRVPMGGVAGVAVDVAHRGKGVASTLIRAGIQAMRDRGEVVSTLYPMNHTLYRRHGWEVAGALPEQQIDLSALGTLPRPSRRPHLRPGERADLPALRELHDNVSRDEPGNLSYGPEFAARRLVTQPGGHEVYVAEHGGVVTGVVVLEREPASDGRSFFTLTVHQLAAADLDSELALLHLLGSHHPTARTAQLVAPRHSSLPALLGERELRPAGQGWCWMTRLVDARAAVEARGYPDDVDVEVHLDISDPVAPWNSGAHVLRVKGGQGHLEPGGRSEVHVAVGTLASLYTGWANPRRLARIGLLPGASDRDVVAIDRAFSGRTPWSRDFF